MIEYVNFVGEVKSECSVPL